MLKVLLSLFLFVVLANADTTPTTPQIAERVKACYSNLTELSFTMCNETKFPNGKRLHVCAEISHADGERVNLALTDKSTESLIYTYESKQDEHGLVHIEERNLRTKANCSSQVLPDDLEETWDLQCFSDEEPEGCLIGSVWRSWVGMKSPRPRELAEMITVGIYAGKDVLDGESCDVVIAIPHTFFVDEKGLLRAWRSEQNGVLKERRYFYQSQFRGKTKE